MAVGYRSSSASGTTDSEGQTKSCPVPAGAVAGDIALLCIEMWGVTTSNPVLTWPTGFTQFIDYASATDGLARVKVAWKRLTGADTGSYTITWSGNKWTMSHCILITGAESTGDPIEATNTAQSSGTALPATSVTTVTQPFLAHFVSNETAGAKTPPTSFTEVQDGDYLATNYRIPATTGTHNVSGGTTAASTLRLVALIAVKAAAAGGATDLVVNGSIQAQTAGNVALTQTHVLAATGATQAQAAASPSLTQIHELAVQSAAHGHVADQVGLAGTATLAVQGATQAQVAGNLDLAQIHELTVAGAVHAQTAETLSLSSAAILVVQDAGHAQAAGAVVLTQAHALLSQDAVHGSSASVPSLSQLHQLVVDSAVHAHSAGAVQFTAPYDAPEHVTANPRGNPSTATAQTRGTTATARQYESTATPRSPQ